MAGKGQVKEMQVLIFGLTEAEKDQAIKCVQRFFGVALYEKREDTGYYTLKVHPGDVKKGQHESVLYFIQGVREQIKG